MGNSHCARCKRAQPLKARLGIFAAESSSCGGKYAQIKIRYY